MNRVEKIRRVISILQTMQYPNEHIKPIIVDSSERIVDLLWAKTNIYEGPLYDGLQNNDWSVISVLVGNWLLESYINITKNNENLKTDIDTFYNKHYMVKFSLNLLRGLVSEGLVDNLNEKDIASLNALSVFTETNFQGLLNAFENLFQGACTCFGTRKSKVQNELEQMSEKQGLLATSMNRLKN